MTEEFFDEIIDDEVDAVESEDFDDDGGEEIDINSRSVVLVKEDMIALLGLKTSQGGGLIVRVDPRQNNPSAQTYDDPEVATSWFNRSLKTSKRNGWIVIYDGMPSFG